MCTPKAEEALHRADQPLPRDIEKGPTPVPTERSAAGHLPQVDSAPVVDIKKEIRRGVGRRARSKRSAKEKKHSVENEQEKEQAAELRKEHAQKERAQMKAEFEAKRRAELRANAEEKQAKRAAELKAKAQQKQREVA